MALCLIEVPVSGKINYSSEIKNLTVKQEFGLKHMIGAILVPAVLIVVGNFISNKQKARINSRGIYVIAKKVKWESAEVIDGFAIFEFYIDGNRISERADGCGDSRSVDSYFVIQYYDKGLMNKIDYLCSDSISASKIKDIDLKATWKEKPIELLCRP